MRNALCVYTGGVTVAIFRQDDGLFIAADTYAPGNGDRTGQTRLEFTEAEAKTLVSAIQYVLGSDEASYPPYLLTEDKTSA